MQETRKGKSELSSLDSYHTGDFNTVSQAEPAGGTDRSVSAFLQKNSEKEKNEKTTTKSLILAQDER